MGVSRFLVKSFLSHSAEKFRRGTLQCVTNFGYRKILCFREFCHDFLLNFFCLTVPKIFVEDPSVFQRISGSENVYAYEGKISIFYGKFVLSQYRKLRRWTLLCFTKFLVSKKFMYKRGGGVSRFFVKSFLSHSAEKFRRGTLLICVSENVR